MTYLMQRVMSFDQYSERAMRDTLRLVWIACAILTIVGCNRTTINDGLDAGSDNDGPDLISCEDVSDCPDETFDCAGGVCLKRCGTDEACDPIAEHYCSDQGYCELGCRDSFSCDDPENEVCADGVCRPKDGAGACATKCDCDAGEICNGGVCQDPPATCTTSDDCGRGPVDRCEAFLCNGFTQQCFDPDPQPCDVNEDCDGRPGCGDGCICTPNQQCVPQGACTASTEAVDCGPGFYCTDDLVCDVLPACTDDTACEALGFECNIGQGLCERPLPCIDDNECTPPKSYCNLGESPSFCDVPTCLNGAFECGEGQTCSVDGRCVTEGTGDACNGNTECPEDQFCSFATGSGICTPGCRSNASCPSGQECNGANQCVPIQGGSGGFVGDSCQADTDCNSGLVCGVFTSVCTETCFNVGEPCDNGACCSLSGSATCDPHPLGFGLIGYCSL
jgi:hypothetical protein